MITRGVLLKSCAAAISYLKKKGGSFKQIGGRLTPTRQVLFAKGVLTKTEKGIVLIDRKKLNAITPSRLTDLVIEHLRPMSAGKKASATEASTQTVGDDVLNEIRIRLTTIESGLFQALGAPVREMA